MNSIVRKMYHTQEKWEVDLTSPIITTNKEAWLGEGYYFWYYEDDAVWWGRTAKRSTRNFQVYHGDINFDNILDTVFNEEHYELWLSNIQKAINKFLKNNRNQLTLKYINDFFKERGLFKGIDGVMFQDISNNPDNWIVKKFQYKKRIQLAVYNLDIISNFTLAFEAECT